MRPEDRQITPSDPRGQIQAPSRDSASDQSAAANVARNQLDSIYSGQASQSSEIPATYRRTHDQKHATHAEQWQH